MGAPPLFGRFAMTEAGGGGRAVLWVPTEVLTVMGREADRAGRDETGGVLLGYWARPATAGVQTGDVVITMALGPGPLAEHRRFSFTPDHGYHEREIAAAYAASGRRWTYLGDWHTHPNGPGELSRQDEATMARIALAPEARAPHPIMLILAGGAPWITHAWCARTGARRTWWSVRIAPSRLDVQVTSSG